MFSCICILKVQDLVTFSFKMLFHVHVCLSIFINRKWQPQWGTTWHRFIISPIIKATNYIWWCSLSKDWPQAGLVQDGSCTYTPTTCSRWYDHEWLKAGYKPDSSIYRLCALTLVYRIQIIGHSYITQMEWPRIVPNEICIYLLYVCYNLENKQHSYNRTTHWSTLLLDPI